jgi:hypothetical protein
MLKKFNKMKTINEIYKKFKITQNLSKEFQIMWDGFKKMRQKQTKKINSPSVGATRGRDPSPSARRRHSGKRLASPEC